MPHSHHHWMHLAIQEAQKALGHTAPNPPVGAILIDTQSGQELARGHHQGPGHPHAEIETLRAITSPEKITTPTTLYITLEPCSTHGRTGPCTDALLRAYHTHHLRTVIYGTTDPNPPHAGSADALLRTGDLTVITDLPSETKSACQHLIRGFAQRHTHQRPWIIAKTALSLDGSPNRPPHESQWLTSPSTRQHSQQLRKECDAIIIGGHTARRDNPHLTYRSQSENSKLTTQNSPAPKPPLLRIVISTRENAGLPKTAHLLSDQYSHRTLIVPSIAAALAALTQHGINRALLESGGQLTQAFQERNLIDEHHTYLAPLLTGGPPTPVTPTISSSTPHPGAVTPLKNDLHQST